MGSRIQADNLEPARRRKQQKIDLAALLHHTHAYIYIPIMQTNVYQDVPSVVTPFSVWVP